MVEGRGGLGFLDEAPRPVAIRGELGGQQLESDFAVELSVLSQIDLTHPAAAQEAENLIATDHLTHAGWLRTFTEQPGGEFTGRLIEHVLRLPVGGNERLDFGPQGSVTGAGSVEISRPPLRRQLQDGLQHLLDLLPLLRRDARLIHSSSRGAARPWPCSIRV